MGGFDAKNSLVERLKWVLSEMDKSFTGLTGDERKAYAAIQESVLVLEGYLLIDKDGKLHEPCNHKGHRILHYPICAGCGGRVPATELDLSFPAYARREFSAKGSSAKIPLIKELRRISGASLKDAKDEVDQLYVDYLSSPPASHPSSSSPLVALSDVPLGAPISSPASRPTLHGKVSLEEMSAFWKNRAAQAPQD